MSCGFSTEAGRDLRGARNARVEIRRHQTPASGSNRQNIGKIFDRFYQVESSHTREHGGTGIGLALTKELVEILKGRHHGYRAPRAEAPPSLSACPSERKQWRACGDCHGRDNIRLSSLPDTTAAVLAEARGASVAYAGG